MTTLLQGLSGFLRENKRMWLPFTVVAICSAYLIAMIVPCRCWYGKVLLIERDLMAVGLAALALRHGCAMLRMERTFAWKIYLSLAIAWPAFVEALAYFTAGPHQ